MKSYSEAQALEESLTVRERLIQESSASKRENRVQEDRSRSRLPNQQLRQESKVKRTIDLALGAVVFLLLGLLYPIIALGIKLSSRGPVLYYQRRTGFNGQEFTCLKFRTMHQMELRRIDGKPVVTKPGDRRVFPFGRLLRKMNLDELPQVINVLKGEMSLVGPRPYPVRECSYWNEQFDLFYHRYSVKPGISGLAQVNGYRGGTLDEEHMQKRLDYDLTYVQKRSLRLDINIISRTVLQMLHLNNNGH